MLSNTCACFLVCRKNPSRATRTPEGSLAGNTNLTAITIVQEALAITCKQIWQGRIERERKKEIEVKLDNSNDTHRVRNFSFLTAGNTNEGLHHKDNNIIFLRY